MLRLSSATKASLKAILLASAVLMWGTFVRAADVTLKFANTVSPAVNVKHNANNSNTPTIGVAAGTMNWTWQSSSSSNLFKGAWKGGATFADANTLNSPIKTFCIELDSATIANNGTYKFTVQHDLSGLPSPGNHTWGPGAMGPDKAAQIQALVDGLFKGLIAGVSINSATPTASVEGALQAAIWHIINEQTANNFNATTGTFKIIGNTGSASGNTAFNNLVASMLSYISSINASNWNNANQRYFAVGLSIGGTNSVEKQDQIVILNRDGFTASGGTIVPVPAGVLMAGMGVICLGGLDFFRRRKVAIIA